MKTTAKYILSLIVPLLLLTLKAYGQGGRQAVPSQHKTLSHTDPNGFHYETVTGDPSGLRLYTLANGMKVYMARTAGGRRIQTYIAVRAGSAYDPADTTGLAHCVEHMTFKGTQEIGTRDWKKEAPLLKRISDLFEKHRAETDPKEKLAIYKQIDSVSQQAAHYAIADEYDELVNSLGTTGHEARTSREKTVYQDKIPSNELDKWLRLEGERFRGVVLRLFHTELEAIYEAFNRGQDNDSQEGEALLDALFPTHPYGQQTVLGRPTDLRNPSMVAIHKYFKRYYAPNNMALVLVGDVDFDRSIQAVNHYFGTYKKREVHFPKQPREKPLTKVITREVVDSSPAKVSIAFRTKGFKSDQREYIRLIGSLVHARSKFLNDYGLQILTDRPRAGQSLEAVKDSLLARLDRIKKGAFKRSEMATAVKHLKLQQRHHKHDAKEIGTDFYESFIHFQAWADHLEELDEMGKITKAELVKFANHFYKDNYAVVYKRQGKNPNLVKLKSPLITPVPLNRGKHSAYFKAFMSLPDTPLKPHFVNYAEKLHRDTLKNGLPMTFVQNKKNDLCSLKFIFDMGSDNDKKRALALGYLDYLGTENRPPKQLQQAFHKLGMRYDVKVGRDEMVLTLSGSEKGLAQGLELLEAFIRDAKANQATYHRYIRKIARSRASSRRDTNKNISNRLMEYVKYGRHSPAMDVYSMDELKRIDPVSLVGLIKGLMHYKHRVFYYGKDRDQAVAALEKYHRITARLKDYPAAKHYAALPTDRKVYLVDRDLVQARMTFLSKDVPFKPEYMAAAAVLNSYFGKGKTAVFPQLIRESKALAYSKHAVYSNAYRKGHSNYMVAYVATQSDKMTRAIEAVEQLLNQPLFHSEARFVRVKEAMLKKRASKPIIRGKQIFWSHEKLRRLGLDDDYEREYYKAVQNMTWDTLNAFFEQHVRGKKYSLLILGNEDDLDLKALSKYGKIQRLDADYLLDLNKP